MNDQVPVTRLERTISLGSQVKFGPASELLPDAGITGSDGSAAYALVFESVEGFTLKQHAFILDENGKQALAQRMSSGLILAGALPNQPNFGHLPPFGQNGQG